MSESEAEDGAGDEEVTLPQDLPGAGNIKQQQSSIKLTEVSHVLFRIKEMHAESMILLTKVLLFIVLIVAVAHIKDIKSIDFIMMESCNRISLTQRLNFTCFDALLIGHHTE